jgi:SAM-dependent methyltransferase
VDVLVRPNTAIPVVAYDGKTLPFEDKSFDAVMMIDVLHHTDDPVATLKECVRVAKQFILVKDHISDSWYDDVRLRFLDWFGNRPFGIPMTYKYLSSREWKEAFAAVGATPTKEIRRIQTCPPPFYYPLDHDLHFIARLETDDSRRSI